MNGSPNVVLTHLEGAIRVAPRPEPVRIARWLRRPASPRAIPRLRKPPAGTGSALRGRPSGLVGTAATNGVLPGAPRPRLPPERTPPRWASSISTRPDGGFSPSRRAITAMIFRFIVQAVACLKPNRRPSSTEEIPFFAVTTGWIAANQTVSGSLVEWRIVPAVSEVRFLQ